MACCLMVPGHYLNKCRFLISEGMWHSPNHIIASAPATILYIEFKNYFYNHYHISQAPRCWYMKGLNMNIILSSRQQVQNSKFGSVCALAANCLCDHWHWGTGKYFSAVVCILFSSFHWLYRMWWNCRNSRWILCTHIICHKYGVTGYGVICICMCAQVWMVCT